MSPIIAARPQDSQEKLVRSLSMSAKLWLLGILATLGLMVIGGVGVFSLSTMSDRVEHDLRSARRDSEIIVTIKSAQSTFLGQIQEWKNEYPISVIDLLAKDRVVKSEMRD